MGVDVCAFWIYIRCLLMWSFHCTSIFSQKSQCSNFRLPFNRCPLRSQQIQPFYMPIYLYGSIYPLNQHKIEQFSHDWQKYISVSVCCYPWWWYSTSTATVCIFYQCGWCHFTFTIITLTHQCTHIHRE